MKTPSPSFTHNDYGVACICPMGLEQAPLEAMLDSIHPNLPYNRDQNSYTLGRMGAHNIVIAAMPEIGNNNAAAVATQLLNDFPCIRFSLLVGIGGGVPDTDRNIDIRLGDVVVSNPSGTYGGVVQFDRGKVLSGGRYERVAMLQKPPGILLASVKRLESLHRRIDSQIPTILADMIRRFPKMEKGNYVHQGAGNDRLFQAAFEHRAGEDCRQCDPRETIERAPRTSWEPVIHYGMIGSSNSVVKDSTTRDRLKADFNILCVEMEAAGLMDSFPCLVIRGICDYADSHKSKRWQPYAAATAAAYAKELLLLVPPLSVPSSMQAGEESSRAKGRTTITTGNVRSLVNGSVTGDIVGGDKICGIKVAQHEWK
ncbi:purine and uridine phosphorylase [Aspergillus campestris IBT 28561]|uniref:Purine and uridine phosphorylase n=1 Tax=Aspergillus campestris (strain IBT 28561) TaxID=1392248 RepID=A0A2I1CYZ1_ASPC2|nr:purine and uridine phosphorylase [Aspergillus campestris IBT 28561]PKY02828.1 purine and uridine phosphorylase [Aspergillus campestris IBT 28561]